jgi:hypothetical protein
MTLSRRKNSPRKSSKEGWDFVPGRRHRVPQLENLRNNFPIEVSSDCREMKALFEEQVIGKIRTAGLRISKSIGLQTTPSAMDYSRTHGFRGASNVLKLPMRVMIWNWKTVVDCLGKQSDGSTYKN